MLIANKDDKTWNERKKQQVYPRKTVAIAIEGYFFVCALYPSGWEGAIDFRCFDLSLGQYKNIRQNKQFLCDLSCAFHRNVLFISPFVYWAMLVKLQLPDDYYWNDRTIYCTWFVSFAVALWKNWKKRGERFSSTDQLKIILNSKLMNSVPMNSGSNASNVNTRV